MTNKITLESADDVATVWANWHQDVMLIIKDGYRAAAADIANGTASGDPQRLIDVFEAITSVVETPPITAEYSINTEVMTENANIVLSILG